MYAKPEELAKATQANVEILLSLASAALASVEQLTALNLDSARASMETTAANARAALQAQDVGDLARLRDSVAHPRVDKAVAYSRSMYEIAAEMQQKLSQLAETQLADLNRGINHSLDQATELGPPGTDVAVAAVKSAVATANMAYESMNTAVKQIAEIAKRNVDALRDAG